LFFVKFITQAKDLCVFFDGSYKLKEFGLTIKELDGGDGWDEYEIVKIEKV